MEVSSSSDLQNIHELAGSLTVTLCHAELEVDDALSTLKDIRSTLKYIREQAHLIHSSGDESRREDILSFSIIVETLNLQLQSLSKQIISINSEMQSGLDC